MEEDIKMKELQLTAVIGFKGTLSPTNQQEMSSTD